jgi:hypothetical protein
MLSSLGFYTQSYNNKLLYTLKNNLTPSLGFQSSQLNISKFPKLPIINVDNSINLQTSQLDILNSHNNNFFYNLTSNPQQLNNTSNYFNNLSNTTNLSTDLYNNIKF